MSPALPALETSRTLPEILARHADRRPERAALTFLDDRGREVDRLTFAELAAQVEDRAGRLAARHEPGARLVLALPTGRDFAVLLFAAMRAGLIPVPAPTPRSSTVGAQRLGAIVRSSGAAALVAPEALRPLLDVGQMGLGASVTALTTPEEIAAIEEYRQPPAVAGDDVAFLQYSSGSTGAPKGVVNRHAALLANERMIRDAMGHDEETVAVSWLPLFHDLGLIVYMLQTLCVGGHLVSMSPTTFLKRPVRWLEAIHRYGAQSSGAPTSSYDACAERIGEAEKEGLDLAGWRTALIAAEPLRAATIRRFQAAFAGNGLRPETVWAAYGLAEATVFVTGQRRSTGVVTLDLDREALARGVARPDPAGTTAVSSGVTWRDLDLRIVDPESRRALGPGEVGEVWIAGSTVSAGYWNDPAATAETFHARLADTGEGPFLRTGDLGFLHDGQLFITGRIKDIIIVEGTNVYPQDIEAAIEDSHPGLRRGHCAAFGVDDGRTELIVALAEVERAAFKEPGDGAAALAEIAAAACAAVARQQDVRLHQLLLVRPGTVPRTSSGKLQRRACRTRYLAGEVEDARLF